MRRVSLLDVNVLIALFDPSHIHHEPAHDWFADAHASGWATCAATENGFIRFFTRPAADLRRPVDVIEHLRTFCASKYHMFWPDAVSLRDATIFVPSFVRGHRQITDVYLLGLAHKMGGHLVTFDRSIPLGAIVGAKPDLLAVIEPAE